MSFFRSRACLSQAVAPVIQALESRRMLSANINDDGVLVVKGDHEDNVITCSLDANDDTKLVVTIDGESESFDLEDFDEIKIDGKKGDDLLEMDESEGDILTDARMKGDKGHDTIHGASGDDRIDGGTGHDEIHGGDGDDRVRGKGGDDSVYGDDGDDRVRSLPAGVDG